MVDLNYNADDLPDDDGFSLITPGKYAAEIIDSEMKDTSSGGKQLSLKCKLLDVEENKTFKNRTVFANLNVVNKNERAVQISQAQLKKIMKAFGLKKVRDSTELHNKPLMIKIGIDKASDEDKANGYDDRNKVKDFGPYKPGAATGPAAAGGSAGGGSAPWG